MKPALQLQIGQQLTLTPQLQQAIRLLQLSTLDLDQEIQNTLESNPMLEATEDKQIDASTSSEDENKQTDTVTEEYIPTELSVDTQWSDVYQHSTHSHSKHEDYNLERLYGTSEDLHTHLQWQLELTPMSDIDHAIATSILDAIDDRGLLTLSLHDIKLSLGQTASVTLEEITVVLHRIQHFEPTGVAARSIEECLALQLTQLAADTPWRSEALTMVTKHSVLLAKRDYKTLQRRMNLSDAEFQATSKLLKSLAPYPGEKLQSTPAEYITPDVLVRKKNNQWQVLLYNDRRPSLQINSYYASLAKKTKTVNDRNYLRSQLQEAKWFLKSIQSRNETLMRVTSCIVSKQMPFLEEGAIAMKPLILNDVAKELNLHESTISRISRQKYMLTPHGIFELKYFFSSHVGTHNGGECSATAIRALIKQFITQEKARAPLSDNKIAELLKKQGVTIARRTVAKYREAMGLLPSHERKYLLVEEGEA